jgi:hypothetical protein
MRQRLLDDPSGQTAETIRSLRTQTAMRTAVYRMSVAKDADIPSGPERTFTRVVPSLVLR